MKKKKLFILLPTFFQGGGERVVSELSLNFPEQIETTIVLFEEKISYPYKGKIISLGLPLSQNIFLRVCYFFLRLLKFRKLVAKEQPDTVMSLGASANAISLLTKKRPIVRVDMFLSESRKDIRGLPFRLFVRFFFHRAEKIIAVSRAIARDLSTYFAIPQEKIQVIYNPVDVEKVKKLSQESMSEGYTEMFKGPVVITMGRLREQKGQWHLIRAFKKVKEAIPNARLIILGDGPLRSYLEELGKDKSIYFLGWQQNPFPFLLRAKLFVLSSLWEGLPDVLLEAIACGLPVISTDCKSGPREILAPLTDISTEAKVIEMGEYGILTPVCDRKLWGAKDPLTEEEKMLAEAMRLVLSDEKQQRELSRKSQERAADFDIKKIIHKWDFLYDNRMD